MPATTTDSVSSTLEALGLESENPGAFDGTWIETSGPRVESLNPATGEPLAAVPGDRGGLRAGRVRLGPRLRGVADLAGAAARRGRPPVGGRAAAPQAGARPPGDPGGGQDRQRGAGRGAGDDRH